MRALFYLVLSLQLFAPSAWAKRIIVDESDFTTLVEVSLKKDFSGTDLSLVLQQHVVLTSSYAAKSEITAQARDEFTVAINSTCLDAAIALYDKLKNDQRIIVSPLIPKPALTGSN